jgi:putative nucleotidyltransferase with HDIG domain
MFTKVIDFFKPPEYDSVEQTQKARFLHISLIVTAIACILLGIQNMPGDTNLDIFLFIVGGISFVCIPANNRGYYTPVAFFITSLMLAVITYGLIVGVGLKDAGLVAYPLFIIFTSYLFSKKVVLHTTLLSIGSVACVYFLDQGGYLHPAEYSDESQFKVILVLFPAAGFLFWAVIDNWDKIIKNLRDTYDLTLSGWGQALEYRHHETEGHSQRVVEMTIALAKRLGIRGRKLDHIRRGALLHDIGKMAVPDALLLKNDSLSDDEWMVVKKHPMYAKNMLESIPFLKPALEIPYSHHERWDGSGYPEGLSKHDIPYAARVFAVVDVWDALISDRPYRKAWSEDKARDYIRDQAGKLFDPQVVEAFLELMRDNKNLSVSG